MTNILSFFNQKGGVGKTTSVLNLASALVDKGKRVLVVDADPQGNLTSGITDDNISGHASLYDILLRDVEIKEAIGPTTHKGLDIIPGSQDSAGMEIELAVNGDWHYLLRNKLQELGDAYDFIFLDCPPSLGVLSIMCLNASDGLISVIQAEYYALEGVSQLINTLNLVKENYNSGLELKGVLLTMYDARNNLSLDVESEVREFFKDIVFKTMIPRNVKLAEAPSHGLSIFDYDKKSTGAESYKQLAKEFLKRFKEI
ncbi:MAG: ParA family protein [Ezakiella sp.]|nr:ParA family protein [Ezakiella sp.]MDD7762245.1 ParA family protein [Bacillota bacterium]MDY3947257.1 ParA family protein [Ezakiella sp.]